MKNRITAPEVNVICLRHGDNVYVLGYADGQESAAMRQFGMMAADPELNFSWHDAGALCRKVRETERSVKNEPNI